MYVLDTQIPCSNTGRSTPNAENEPAHSSPAYSFPTLHILPQYTRTHLPLLGGPSCPYRITLRCTVSCPLPCLFVSLSLLAFLLFCFLLFLHCQFPIPTNNRLSNFDLTLSGSRNKQGLTPSVFDRAFPRSGSG